MKVVNATWEKRNLGLKVCEITFQSGDAKGDFSKILDENIYDYYVARVPSTEIQLVHDLESIGFRYLENQMNIYFDTIEIHRIDERWIGRFGDYTCNLCTGGDEFDEIISRTRSGLFEKDRMSVDPLIDKSLPDKRVANWILDMQKQADNSIYIIRKSNEMVGFFILRKTAPLTSYVEMAAIFSEYRKRGLAFLLIYNILVMAAREGSKRILASLSTNNISTINTFTRFINFRIQDVSVVLRKYQTNK